MEEFMSGFPPPPFFYQNYSLKEDSTLFRGTSGSQEDGSNDIVEDDCSVFDYEKYKQFDGPPPPLPPEDSWYSFGSLERLVEYTEPLDSDMAIALDPNETDARVHFRRLYSDFIASLLKYLNSIKTMDGNYVTHIKQILKVYVNLQHILASLSERYAEDKVIEKLKEQLKQRRRYIDSMKVLLVKVKETIENETAGQKQQAAQESVK